MSTQGPTTATSGTHDVFISYARADQPFVRRLTEALAGEGRRAWVDWADIPPTAEWMVEIRAAIDAADTYLAVLSPDSVRSKVCAAELDQALQANKRIVPVLIRPVDESSVPDQVAKLNWVSFTDGFESGLARLVEALDTDLEHVRAHTHLLVRARDWEGKAEDNALLIRGRELVEAEAWLSGAGSREPHPTALQTRFLLASRRAATRRQRGAISGVTAMFLVAAVLGVVALDQRNAAVERERIARSREIAATAVAQLERDPELSLLLATEGARIAPTEEAEQALREALAASHVESVLRTDGRDVYGAAYSPDGLYIASVGEGAEVLVRDAESGKVVKRLQDPTPQDCRCLFSVGFSPNGRLLAAGDFRGRVLVWSTRSWRRTAVLSGHRGEVWDVEFSPDGLALATAGADGTIRLYDAGKLRSPRILRQASPVLDLSFSPDGRRLASTDGRVVQIWNAGRGTVLSRLSGRAGTVESVAFDPLGSLLATGHHDGTVRLWDVTTGRVQAVLSHPDPVLKVAFSPDGSLLATATGGFGRGGLGRIWDVSTGKPLRDLRGHSGQVDALAFHPDGERLLTGGLDDTIRIWRIDVRESVPTLGERGNTVSQVEFAPRGESLLSVSSGVGQSATLGVAQVWDADARRVLVELPSLDGVHSVAYAPEGNMVATTHGQVVRLWTAPAGKLIATLPPAARALVAVQFAPGGETVAAMDRAGVVQEFDLEDFRIKHTVQLGSGPPSERGFAYGFAFGPENSSVVAWGFEGARVWELESGRVITRLVGANDGVAAASFSRDGTLIAGAGQSGAVYIWDALSGDLKAQLPGHRNIANDVAFSPDGSFLVSVGLDPWARIWDVGSTSLIAELPTGASYGVSVSADGSRVAAAGADGLIRIFGCELCAPLEGLVRLAESRATRGLTSEERATYLGNSS